MSDEETSYQEFVKEFHELEYCLIDMIRKGHTNSLKKVINTFSCITFCLKDLLHEATVQGNTECVKFLLEKGANPLSFIGTTLFDNYKNIESLFIEFLERNIVAQLENASSENKKIIIQKIKSKSAIAQRIGKPQVAEILNNLNGNID